MGVFLNAADSDGAAASRQHDSAVGMVSHGHELGEGRVAEDGVGGQADGGYVEDNFFGAVVLSGPVVGKSRQMST